MHGSTRFVYGWTLSYPHVAGGARSGRLACEGTARAAFAKEKS
jgi:hypothetical protein